MYYKTLTPLIKQHCLSINYISLSSPLYLLPPFSLSLSLSLAYIYAWDLVSLAITDNLPTLYG